jgi:hypothetical protein
MRKSLMGWLVEEGSRAAGRAAGTVLAREGGQEAVARAVGLAQRGLEALGGLQKEALHAMGLAAKPDYDEVRKRLARIKRKVREIDRKVARGGGAEGGGEPGDSR